MFMRMRGMPSVMYGSSKPLTLDLIKTGKDLYGLKTYPERKKNNGM